MSASWKLAVRLLVLLGFVALAQGLLAPPAQAAPLHVLNLALIGPGVSCTEALAKGANTVAGAVADGSQGIVLCAHVEDVATNTDQGGIPVIFTASVGTVGATGTTKSTTVLTSSSGVTSISYRGAGLVAGTDTIVASYLAGSAIATETLVLVAPVGRTAGKMVLTTPSTITFAPSVTDSPLLYSSPVTGTLVALQVREPDSAVGVDNQTVLLTVDRGAVVANPAFSATVSVACAGASTKSLALTTIGTNLSAPGAQAAPGTINFAICGDQRDAPGKITLKAQNMSAPMADTTASFTQAGRPATLEASASGTTITAKVGDSQGNPVADGTPVRFILPAAAGSMSRVCALTMNGVATSVAAASAGTATILVTADYNEGGTRASTCNAPGTQQVSSSVTVGSGGSGSLPLAGGAGTVASSTIPVDGGLGFIISTGGTATQLVAASACPAATAAFYATVAGEILPYVAAAPAIVNAAFLAAFPTGIPAGTALLGRCR